MATPEGAGSVLGGAVAVPAAVSPSPVPARVRPRPDGETEPAAFRPRRRREEVTGPANGRTDVRDPAVNGAPIPDYVQ
ncbi:hypothetical protein GCM10027187_05050 [Streptosporangium sandarakinum]